MPHKGDFVIKARLKTPWRNGTMHVIFEPLELLEKLAALVAAPRVNLVHSAKWRASIVPASGPDAGACNCENDEDRAQVRPPNYAWATLMARVFEVDGRNIF
jgi:hypothetical protein